MAARNPGKKPTGPRGPVKARATATPRRPEKAQKTSTPRPSDLLQATRFEVKGATKLTSRAGVLLVVMALLVMSYASSMKAYLVQRAHINQLHAEIDESRDNIAALQRERDRWDDPEYVKQQARERFGYVLPGEVSLVVIDADGNPIDPEAKLANPGKVLTKEPVAWWSRAWASMETAGNPPPLQAPPADSIGKPQGKR